MSLIFPYTTYPTPNPIWTLHGRQSRPRPVIFVAVVGPNGTAVEKGLLDSGADDTVFPDVVASDIGIDLSQAPTGAASGVGSGWPEGTLRYNVRKGADHGHGHIDETKLGTKDAGRLRWQSLHSEHSDHRLGFG